jgi:AraC-like DNA-binding protein
MNSEDTSVSTEIRRLKNCISDLLTLSASQAISRGGDPERVIGSLLEVLLRALGLDLAYAEFKPDCDGPVVVLARSSHFPKPETFVLEVRKSVESWLTDSAQTSPITTHARSSADVEVSVALLKLGSYPQLGWLLACSRRDDFPTQSERLLLGAAANQGALGVEQAHLLRWKTRVAQELERKVAQRTKELRASNAELERALKQVDTLRDTLQRENVALREQAASTQGGLAPWQLRRAQAILNRDLAARIRLGQLAEACGLSVRHFARAFRQSTGAPPHRWRLNRRVDRAKELLGDSTLSLLEVALACGFGDQSHFTRIFAATVGLSPGLWRRLQPSPAIQVEHLSPPSCAPVRTLQQQAANAKFTSHVAPRGPTNPTAARDL